MYDIGIGGPRDLQQAAHHLVDNLRDCDPVVAGNLTGNFGWFEADTITTLQQELKNIGAYSGSADGQLGSPTTAVNNALCG